MARRKIIWFTTPAGTGLSLGSGQTHGGGSHIPTPQWLKHWGIMIGTGEDDSNATVFELQKGSMLNNLIKGDHELKTPIKPLRRSRTRRQKEESNEHQLKFKDTELTTILDDDAIEKKGDFVYQVQNNTVLTRRQPGTSATDPGTPTISATQTVKPWSLS
jgi:hypothetical protein